MLFQSIMYPFRILLLVGASLTFLGCNSDPELQPFVVRVGGALLTEVELSDALENLAVRNDTLEARRQYIEQWITTELLYQEAVRRGLLDEPDVRRRLAENERSVLIDAFISSLYQSDEGEIPTSEQRRYYELHKEQLRLREPFVRVFYWSTSSADSASLVHAAFTSSLRDLPVDTVWSQLLINYNISSEVNLSNTFYPESQLFAAQTQLQEALTQLQINQTSAVIQSDEGYHFVHLADRVPPGTVPEYAWIKDEIRLRLTIDRRKQMYERQVQRLRTEALSRDALEIR